MTRLRLLVLVSLVLAACSGTPEASAVADTDSTPLAAPTNSQSVEPEPTREDSGPPSFPPCEEGAVCGGPAAGEFTSTSTGATITFTVPDDGWQGQQDLDGAGFAIFREDGGGYAGISVTSFSGEVFAQSCNSFDDVVQIENSTEAFMAWIREREGITASEPADVTVGGRPALQVDVTIELPPECTEPPWIWLWSLPVVGDFHLNDGETARLYAVEAVEAADTTVLIVVEAFEGVDWEPFLASAMTILEGMEIDAGS